MGMPAKTVAATTPTKNTSRLSWPRPARNGGSSDRLAIATTTPASAMRAGIRGYAAMRSSTMTLMSTMPSGIATARQLMEMSSDMMLTIASFAMYP